MSYYIETSILNFIINFIFPFVLSFGLFVNIMPENYLVLLKHNKYVLPHLTFKFY
jgi:hypothetical protein